MHIDICSTLGFWAAVAGGYGIIYKLNNRQKTKLPCFIATVFLLSVVIQVVSEWHWAEPARRKAQETFYGQPISNKVKNLEGKVFHPKAFLLANNDILVYNDDGKVYSLYGITLDGKMTALLKVSSDAEYVVYRKAGALYFGKL